MTGTDEDYEAQWDRLHFWEVASLATSLGGFALVVLLMLTTTVPGWSLFTYWMVASLVASSSHNLFRCPRCHKHFFKPNSWSVNTFLKSCPHCGLPKWASN